MNAEMPNAVVTSMAFAPDNRLCVSSNGDGVLCFKLAADTMCGPTNTSRKHNDAMPPAATVTRKSDRDELFSPAARLKSDDKPPTQRRVGDGWGTNIHWTSPPGGESEIVMLSRAY